MLFFTTLNVLNVAILSQQDESKNSLSLKQQSYLY